MFNLRHLDRSSVWFFLVALVTISFPWNERFSSIGIILLVLHWLFDSRWIEKIRSVKINWGIGLLWGFWILHVLLLVRTQNIHEGIHSIEVKLSFLILPLLFSTENYLDRKNVKQLLMLFCISCGLSLIYALSWSIFHFYHIGWANVLARMNISGGVMHPGYYANYFAFGLVFLFYEVIESKKKFSKSNVGIYLLIAYFLIIELLLVSKTAILFLACFFAFVLWYFISFIKDMRIRIGVFLFLILILGGVSSKLPQINDRIVETEQNLTVSNEDVKFANSTKARLVAWELEWKLIAKKWILGYGTGNANAQLMQSFKQNKYSDLVLHNMHTHNQVLHTWLDLGLLGVLLLLTWIGYFIIHAIQKSKAYLFWLMLLILINCLTDDMLEIQAGAVFFLFFLSIFSFKPNVKKGYYS